MQQVRGYGNAAGVGEPEPEEESSNCDECGQPKSPLILVHFGHPEATSGPVHWCHDCLSEAVRGMGAGGKVILGGQWEPARS
ncbi:hypothetical protein LCGC14_2655640 [marine sediment metagenome]|uniref:Uncharacterized protein n=1 Tax=marine sediment metagenome TaxID=412755 RepID=A0A0F9C3V1_9ZZZZ